MIEFKVADAKISAEARQKLAERSEAAGISAAESCHAALRTQSLYELEASWSFWGDTGTARCEAPLPGLKG